MSGFLWRLSVYELVTLRTSFMYCTVILSTDSLSNRRDLLGNMGRILASSVICMFSLSRLRFSISLWLFLQYRNTRAYEVTYSWIHVLKTSLRYNARTVPTTISSRDWSSAYGFIRNIGQKITGTRCVGTVNNTRNI